MTVSEKAWREEYSFLDEEEIGDVFVAPDIEEAGKEPVSGYRREDLYFDFDLKRPLTVRELSPELSNRILERYGFDPYSEDVMHDSEILGTGDGDEFLRVGDRDQAVYFQIGDSPLPREPEYLQRERPRWRS